MKGFPWCSALAALSLATGCGDNSKVCGPGTDDLDGDGYCEPGGARPMCSDGTILDPATNACVIDPTACQNGTVLINNRCVDPTEGLVIDLSEGPEPNNAGTGGIEASGAFAGGIELEGQGETFVVKGTINPFRDADGSGVLDPDMDTYTLSVDTPALLEISVDGVNGLMGAFLVVPLEDNPAIDWRRFGLNITGDTSKRLVFLPAAGRYGISVADTRSLFLDAGSPPAAGNGAAAGHPQAHYFMSITVLAPQAPAPLTVTGGVATSTGTLGVGDVKLFTAPMGLGLNEIELAIPTTPRAAVAVTRNNVYKGDGVELDSMSGPLPARVVAGGFLPGDSAVIAVDTVYHYGPGPVPYTLTVRQGDAVPLSRTGGTASHPEVAGRRAAFYYDAATAGEVTGFALTWNQPVGGMIVDDGAVPVASFTFDPTARAFTNRTFTSYSGLIRHRAAGRHYFLVFDPAQAGPTDIVATSTITALAVGAVAKGTPLANQTVSPAFRASAFTYDAGGVDRWQLFDVTGTGTGAITASFFDPAGTYGRLGPLTTAGTDAIVEDTAPIFSHSFPETGGPRGRVLLDDPTTSFLVTARIAAPAAAPSVTLDFEARGHHDFMAIAAGQTANLAGQVLDAANPARLYLMRAMPGQTIRVTVTPVTPTLDTRIQRLSRDELVQQTFNSGIAGAADIAQFLQASPGWTALSVSPALPLVGSATFDLSIGVSAFALTAQAPM